MLNLSNKNLQINVEDEIRIIAPSSPKKQLSKTGDDDDEEEKNVILDSAKGWFVCFTSCLTNGTIFGIINTFGKLMGPLKKEFATNQVDQSSKIALVGSIQVGVIFFMSSLTSIFVDRFGIRVTAFCGALIAFLGLFLSSFVQQLELFYLTYCFLFGIGASLVYTPSLIILGHYFYRHLGLANGIVTLGSGVFTIVLPFLLDYLLNKVGLKWTLRVLSGLTSLLMVYSLTWKATFKHRRDDLDAVLSRESLSKAVGGCFEFLRKFVNVQIWKNRNFLIWVFCLPMSLFGYFIPFYFFGDFLSERLHQEAEARYKTSILIMCLGGASAVSRVASGKISDWHRVNRVRLQQVAFVVMGTATCLLPLCKNFAALVTLALIMGICDGCFISLIGPIAFDLCGPVGASQAVGFLFGLISIPMTVGPPLAGLLRDRVGSFDIVFYVAGSPPIIGAIVMFLISHDFKDSVAVKQRQDNQKMASQELENITAEYEKAYVDPKGIWQKIDQVNATRENETSKNCEEIIVRTKLLSSGSGDGAESLLSDPPEKVNVESCGMTESVEKIIARESAI